MQNNLFKRQLNDYWRNIEKKILICFIILFILGLFFSFSSTSSIAGESLNKNYYFFFSKHLIFFILSISIMIFISFIESDLLKKSIIPLFIIFFLLLILVPIVGIEVKGAKRWLDLYFFRLQPIEILKPFFVLMTSTILLSKSQKVSNSSYGVSFLILLSIVIFLINQPDVGQSILLTGTWISIVFISGIAIFYILGFFVSFTISVSSLLYFFPEKFGYITKRLVTFMDPSKGDSFQSGKALDAIRQGGLKGQGMGEGILKDRVPEAHTDYIIAVITEEFGSIISIFIVGIFLYITYRIIKICVQTNDDNIKITLSGLSSLLIFQTFIHIGVNTSLLPTTGMTLPFLSYGGSSLLGSAVLAGVILNYTKNKVNKEAYD